MTLKFGYNLEKSTDNRNGEYTHLYLAVFSKQDKSDQFRRCVNISWQGDRSNPGTWYGMKVSIETGVCATEFSAAVKFLSKLEKADMYRESASMFVLWMSEQLKSVQLVYDTRLSKYVTMDEFNKTETLSCFKFFRGSDYYDNILAATADDAFLAVAELCKNHSYPKYVLRDRDTWRFEEVYEASRQPLTLENWVSNPFI